MNAAEVKARLADRALEICEMLLPAGKRLGAEWCAGSTNGEAGTSLKVHLTGSKAGVWQDFAGDAKGDILDLWMAVRGVEFIDALKQAKEHLGITETRADDYRAITRVQKTYSKPITSPVEPLQSGGAAFDYLTKTRMLDAKTLHHYKVGQFSHMKFGPAIVFPCYDTDGKEVDLLKFLAVERKDGKKAIWASADSKPRLFGWQGIDRNKRDAHITEGEIDCLTLAGWGLNAMSLPQGCKNMEWIEHDYEALEAFEKIYIWTDMDEPGRKAAAEIASRLGRERCYRVELPAPHKDANAAQCEGNCDFADFQDAIDQARTLDPVELRSIHEFGAEGWEAIHPTSQASIGTEPPINLPWRCRFGEVSVWTGWSGHGKTLALNNFVVHDANQGERCCIASLEMSAAKLVAALTKIVLGEKPSKDRRDRYDAALGWLHEKIWLVNKTGVLHWSKLLPIMEYAARRYGCTRFVVDSLMRLGIAEDDYDGQKECVSAIVEFAAKHGHVHIVCHSRKQEDETKAPGKFDVRGAVAITDLIDNGFTVWRNKAKEQKLEDFLNGKDEPRARAEIERQRDSQISLWKQRDQGDEPWRNLWLHRGSGQFLNSVSAEPRVYCSEPEALQAEFIDEPEFA